MKERSERMAGQDLVTEPGEESRMPTHLDFYKRPSIDALICTFVMLTPDGSVHTQQNPLLKCSPVPPLPL